MLVMTYHIGWFIIVNNSGTIIFGNANTIAPTETSNSNSGSGSNVTDERTGNSDTGASGAAAGNGSASNTRSGQAVQNAAAGPAAISSSRKKRLRRKSYWK